MDTAEKERLALTGDDSLTASGLRMKAARLVTGLGQARLAEAAGITKSAISNIENGRSYPSRQLMSYLFRAHRIDFNFSIAGQFAQLPADVQAALFDALAAARNGPDQESNSD